MKNKCLQCGLCCRIFLININEEEYRSGKYETELKEFGFIDDFREAEKSGVNILKQKTGGGCIYSVNNSCSIHEIRPQVCREFFCTSKLKKFKIMIEQIETLRASLKKKKEIKGLR